MNDPGWIWQQPNWPHFSWQIDALAPLLRACAQAQGRLLGMLGAIGDDTEEPGASPCPYRPSAGQSSLLAEAPRPAPPIEQIKVLNRLLDGGERGFEDGISAAQYQTVTKVSKATATRHLSDLLEKGCLVRLPGGGRSTRYRVNTDGGDTGVLLTP